MSIVKVIEVICEGDSIEDAIKSGISEAAKTVKHIKQLNVDNIEAKVEKNKVVKYRVNARISFVVER